VTDADGAAGVGVVASGVVVGAVAAAPTGSVAAGVGAGSTPAAFAASLPVEGETLGVTADANCCDGGATMLASGVALSALTSK